MKKILKALLKTTVGRLILSIHIEIFLDFLKDKVVKKYGNTMRSDYILTFLDAVKLDLTEFLEKDFLQVKALKDLVTLETEKINTEYLTKKEQKEIERLANQKLL